ncbi:MAG: hypothetical protein A3D67_00340 [Candidatus Lloydbacteria bacterium RIFCSPHIGHO2_02_FULL_51_22]|uniref:Mannose-6-phosphate isomerase type II C-terminal domain-containing protein n=1 Tax=Candidatus Lloydbacteria bacterium RIFCSPHIGHO2_02_FULL_51_22 TaxID=1798663 RepID=A0A1G2DE04_9BACT|nr:MAG: hypothetical protein A3D67_00340 [Candidatus Lloydbacteria bacterium RIFCSPHIGHO2_02_FULL_51_22]
MSLEKPFTVTRPWGEFRQYAENETVTVKTIIVRRGECFSLQYHRGRTEFWRILAGTPEVTVGDAVSRAKAGDEFAILPEMPHRVAAIDDDVEFLEIARGEFREDDIVRLEDKYGRI